MALAPEELTDRARRVRLLLLDVDGVLTDGRVIIESGGGESKAFSIRDGSAIVWAQRAGIEVALLSGRPSEATTRRAAELGIRTVLQPNHEKRDAFQGLLLDRGLRADEIAYMGDDLLDLPVLRHCGLSAAPADAAADVLSRVNWISGRAGGDGAVREFVELLLRARDSWTSVLEKYLD